MAKGHRLERAWLVRRRCDDWDQVDCHPLIREHYAARLRENFSRPASEAHKLIYEHLESSVPELPDNLVDMMPLYHAVAHACAAGLHQQCYEDVYVPRILRRDQLYSTRFLHAYGIELVALEDFFERQ